MTRLVTQTALIVAGLLTVGVLLIRAQPYDDTELRVFLTPAEDCPSPCLLEITPGMAAQNALGIIRNHPWIAEIYDEQYDRRTESGGVEWVWSELVGAFVNRRINGQINFYAGRVASIRIETHIALWEALLVYGQPRLGYFLNNAGQIINAGFYKDEDFFVWVQALCPTSSFDFMSASVALAKGSFFVDPSNPWIENDLGYNSQAWQQEISRC